MKKEFKLSICMMIKDEEKNLIRCLESIKPLIDCKLAELIIVDTGSSDRSIEIAKKYTDKIYFHEWNKNFSEMRNITISYAKGEWIFILDADERLNDYENLILIMNSSQIENINTILLQVKSLYNDNYEDSYNLAISERIFKNDGEFKYKGVVHNQPMSKSPKLKVDISITHFGYVYNDKDLMDKKFKRTSELLKNELIKDPNNLYYIYQLGVSYDMHGDKKEALSQFRKAYSILKRKNIKEKKLYMYIYGAYCKVAYSNNQYNECRNIAKETLELEGDYIDLYYILAILEKELGNSEEAFKYYNKYLKLVKKYKDLEISKNMSIIMYHIDDKCISNIYFELYQYYFNREDYISAYDNYKKLTTINQRIYASINILIKLEKYEELKGIYDSLDRKEDKEVFLITLENKLKNIDDLIKKKIYIMFSFNEDTYGQLNLLRVNEDEKNREELAISLIDKIDFNDSFLYYSEVFKYLKNNIKLIIEKFKKIEVVYLRNIINELIKESDFKDQFEKYILDFKENNNIDDIKVKNSILYILMMNYIQNNSKINDKYLEIFKLYIKYGVEFVSSIYQIEKAEDIYKYINNEEDRFFMLIYIIEKYINVADKKIAIKYMLELIHLNKGLIKFVEIYKDEILNLKEENYENENVNEEFENYKLLVKQNIITLINNKKLNEAKQIINEYEEIVRDDVEIYSMKAIIYTMEGNMEEAKLILEDGLRLYPKNEDLLYNLKYLLSKDDFNYNRILLN